MRPEVTQLVQVYFRSVQVVKVLRPGSVGLTSKFKRKLTKKKKKKIIIIGISLKYT